MRIQHLAVAVATAALVGTTGVAVAQGDRNGPVLTAQQQAAALARAAKGTRLTVVERATTDTTTDTGASGDSVGDVLTFANRVYDEQNQTRVGTDNGFCVRTKVHAAYECTWTTKLDGGSLTVSGPFYDAHDSVLAVVGGTGDYAGVGGTMRLHARDAAGSAYDFVYRLTR